MSNTIAETSSAAYVPRGGSAEDGTTAEKTSNRSSDRRLAGGDPLAEPTLTLDPSRLSAQSARGAQSASSASPAFTQRPMLSPSTSASANAPLNLNRMIALITDKQFDNVEIQTNGARERLETAATVNEDLAAKRATLFEDRLAKLAEASKTQSSTLDWVLKGVGLAGAALALGAAIVFTGGLAAPLVIVAGIGLAAALVDTASSISQAAGGPSLDPAEWLQRGFTSMLESFGVPKDQAEAGGKIMAIVAFVVAPQAIGNAAGGIAQLAGADEATQAIISGVVTGVAQIGMSIGTVAMSGGAGAAAAAGKVVSTVEVAAKWVNTGTQAVSSAGNITGGGLKAATVTRTYEADLLKVDATRIEANLMGVQRDTQTQLSTYETAVSIFALLVGKITEMLKQSAEMQKAQIPSSALSNQNA
ncbi:type III secretion system translocon subunit SctE [Paraburkholderia agricolaris]|uniref:type III secretion system translocon subunit SctE n=1 Tax=Paraburkholderia agricolaris TaxID=2152888 RepID=UPI0012924D74|nr:type III secretion system translocon subunit SctE [Paraburkholderia agricolaris]